jgi:hypothetical protein
MGQSDLALFFVNDDHRHNYQRCIDKFQCGNREYSSTCYLAAHPDIFKCFALDLQVHGPFDWYFEYLHDDIETEGSTGIQQKGSTAPLTSQTVALVHLALNLWNGSKFDLADGLSIWDSDLYKVALQAIELRRH